MGIWGKYYRSTVSEWLGRLGLEEDEESLFANGVDHPDILPMLSDQDLQEAGIAKIGEEGKCLEQLVCVVVRSRG